MVPSDVIFKEEYSFQSQYAQENPNVITGLHIIKVAFQHIRHYNLPPGPVGFMDDVHLGTARAGVVAGAAQATNVEECTCSDGHLGQFCQSCVPGLVHSPYL